MSDAFEKAGLAGKELVDTGLESLAAFSTGMQAIAAEAADYSRRSMESGTEIIGKVIGAASPEQAIEAQVTYAREAYEGFVAEATRMSELYAELARDVYKPFEALVVRGR
jgi:hypothetical protein